MFANCLLLPSQQYSKNSEVMAKALDAEIRTPQQTNPEETQKYDLVGFGAGIDGGKHYKVLIDYAEKLPQVDNKDAFIFSTGSNRREETSQGPLTLREKLEAKGYRIIDEFQCRGFNTNVFLKYFGGMNKGRPNEEDLKHAEIFAEKLKFKQNYKRKV